MKATLYSRASRSPSSRFTCLSGQSALLPGVIGHAITHVFKIY